MPQERSRIMVPAKRIRTFKEIRLGISRAEVEENARILLDRERSVKGNACPLGTDVFGVLRFLVKRDFISALALLLETNPLPAVTGRLFPEVYAETQAFNRKAVCVSWRAIERFLGDHIRLPNSVLVRERQKIAVIGSGPAGLTAAFFLRKSGFRVTIFESSHVLGGVLSYAYPCFRLPEQVPVRLIENLRETGVNIEANIIFGRGICFDDLKDNGFAAVLLANGAGISVRLLIDGSDASGIFSVEEVLRLRHWMKAGDDKYQTPLNVGKNVLITGFGERVIDVARILVRLQRHVKVLVAGSEGSVGVDSSLLREAVEEGVDICFFVRPKAVISDHTGCFRSLVCEKMNQIDGVSDRGRSVGEVSFEADTLVTSLGVLPNTLFLQDITGLEFNADGTVWTNASSDGETSLDGVFACGNLVLPQAGLVDVINSAKRTAMGINKFLDN